MEYLSNIKLTFLNYLWNRKSITMLVFYFMSSVLLVIFFDVDALIPCVFKTIFHFDCLGCGLTSAFIQLLKLNIKEAYQTNALLFVVLPIGTYVFLKDLIAFSKS